MPFLLPCAGTPYVLCGVYVAALKIKVEVSERHVPRAVFRYMMVRRFNCLGHAQRIYTPLRRPHSLRPCSRDPPSHLRVITEWHAVTCVLDQNAKVEPLLVPKQNESGTRMGGWERRNGQSRVSHESFVRSGGWVLRSGTVARVRLRLCLSIDCLWYALTVL